LFPLVFCFKALTRLSQSRYENGFFDTNNICSDDLFRAGGLIQFLALFRKGNRRSLLAGRLVSEAQSNAFLSRVNARSAWLIPDRFGILARRNPRRRNNSSREYRGQRGINLFFPRARLSPANSMESHVAQDYSAFVANDR